MPRISKKVLLQNVVHAIGSAGWKVDILSKAGEHPMLLRMRRDASDITARVYIWAVSPGGRANLKHEKRIQITSDVARFALDENAKTLVLGWSTEFGVYAGFDVTRHAGVLGSSPSIQIGKNALLRAGETGAAMHVRRNGEVAVAVRPEILAKYIERLELLRNKASAIRQIGNLRNEFNAQPYTDGQAEQEAQHALAEIEAGRAPRLGDPNEVEQRRTIIERLDAIEKRMADLLPARMGHNQPPEAIETAQNSDAAFEEARDASRAIATEVAKSVPDVAEVARRTTLLAGAARRLQRAGDSLKEFGKQIKKKTQEKAVEVIAATLVGGGGTIFHEQIGNALRSLSTWFKMLF